MREKTCLNFWLVLCSYSLYVGVDMEMKHEALQNAWLRGCHIR